MGRLVGMVSPHDIAGKRRCARWRYTVLGGLLEGVGQRDQTWFAEGRTGEGHAIRSVVRVKPRRERRARGNVQLGLVGDEPTRHDDARVPGAGRDVGATVRREQNRVEAGAKDDIKATGLGNIQIFGAVTVIANGVGAARAVSRVSAANARIWPYLSA